MESLISAFVQFFCTIAKFLFLERRLRSRFHEIFSIPKILILQEHDLDS